MTTPQLLNGRIQRRNVKATTPHSPLIRQWQLLEWLSSKPDGVSVREASEATGVDQKTIRRDLILLRKVGFDLEEVVGERGKKFWRVRQPFERLRSKKRQYRAILDSLDVVLMQAELAEDNRLAKDLKALRSRVNRKCK